MMDDSLSDTVRTETSLPMPAPFPQTDQALIAELKRRGYKVYPEKRVRIYSAQNIIAMRAVLNMDDRRLAALRGHVQERMAVDVGRMLRDERVIVHSREVKDGDEIHRGQVCVVLPNGWDFEAEMWGMRP